MTKVKVLLLGAAFSADLHMDAYSRCMGIAEIVGICDKNVENIKALAKKYELKDFAIYDDFKTAIEEVECDVVDICLPNFLHYAAAMEAFKKNRNIISEKPLATTVEDAEKMVATAKKIGKKIYYAEDWLFAPAVNRVRELIEEGAIGKPLYIRARECHSGSHSIFTQSIKSCGGGCMIHLGIHPIGFILALKNGEWTELMGMTSGGGESNINHQQMEGEDWSVCTMRFSDGTSALLEANYLTMGGMEDVIDVYGTEGCLHVDLTFSSAINGFSVPGFKYTVEKAEITTGWAKPVVDEKHSLGYVDEIRHFMECLIKNEDAKIGLRGIDGLESLKVVKLVYKSSKEGIKIVNDRQFC